MLRLRTELLQVRAWQRVVLGVSAEFKSYYFHKITLPNARQQRKVIIANLFAEMKAVGSNASYRIVFLDQGVQYTLDLSPAERDYLYTQEADLVEGAQQKVNEMLTKPVSVPEAEIASLHKSMLFRAFSGEPAPS